MKRIMSNPIERLSTGIPEIDRMIAGGIPRGFLVACTGEPGTGKTIFSIHFIGQGIREGDICIFVTTEESRDSIVSATLFSCPDGDEILTNFLSSSIGSIVNPHQDGAFVGIVLADFFKA